ncbi:MAG: hypothetical protein MRZ45_09235 [Blautia sp.]|nr:hypothetical protein [Blautia sp.]
MKANETIGTFTYDDLIVDGKHSLDVKSVSITVAKGTTLSRGTVIGTDGKIYAGAGSTSIQPDCILTDEVVGTGSATVVTAYKSGNFNKDALVVASTYTLTSTDIETLRTKGIFVEAVVD